jgi:PAS domain-containing protein
MAQTSGAQATPLRPAPIVPERSEDIGDDRRAAIQAWKGKAIDEQIHSRSLDLAYRRWLFQRVSQQPRLRDMFAEANMFDQTILSLKIGNDYLVVGQSDSYVAAVGQDMRGTLISEMKFATANSLRDLYDECLAENHPVYARYISSLSNRNVYWETMMLPLAASERSKPIFVMCYMSLLNEKIDLLRILYDRSPVGIVAAVPIMDGKRTTDDARVLTMNLRAREILRLPEGKGHPHTVGEMIRYLSVVLHWTPHSKSSQGHATTIEFEDPEGRRFRVTIELINHFILISLAPAVVEETPSRSRFARLLGLIDGQGKPSAE